MASDKDFIAIAGNPNSGKTTAFNWYTGARQHVGNYPGITVEKKEGTALLDGRAVTLVDLPGTYSLTAYSLEEVVARRELAEERPGAVLNVINAGVLERNLYLTVQMLEMGVPVVLALNMMDEVRARGVSIDTKRLYELTGLRAVPAVARSGEGLKEALASTLALAEERRGQEWTALEISYGPDIDAALARMTPLVRESGMLGDRYPARWVALKYLEEDEEIMAQGQAAAPQTHDALRGAAHTVAAHLKSTLNSYPEALIADYRYGYIASVLRQGVLTEEESIRDRIAFSDKIDQVLTGRFFGPLILVALLYAMYFITFELGAWPSAWLAAGFDWFKALVASGMDEGFLKSLLTSGIIDGVGSVLGFVPLIMIMFLLIAVLEDSGYMARVAYMMDRIFRFFGLHGASIMPFIVSGGIAGGCAVPGVLATRTLRSPRERLATMLTAPFMACGAKLPVFLLFVGVFFKNQQALVMFLLTMTGWLFALLVAKLLRSTLIRGEATPFVMELPPYRFPTVSGVLIHTWERTWEYIRKAGTIILAISILVWAGMSFPGLPAERVKQFADQKVALAAQRGSMGEAGDAIHKAGDAATPERRLEAAIQALENEEAAEALRHSYAGRLGTALEPLSAPAGFDWRTNIALLGGIAAKEVVVATLGTAYSLGQEDTETNLAERVLADSAWTMPNAVALLLFTLLYSPCFVTLAVIKQESGKWRWPLFSLFFNLALAYAVAVAAHQVLRALSGTP